MMSRRRKLLSIAVAIGLSLSLFAIDLFSRMEGAIAVLYVTVILLVAPVGREFVAMAGIGTGALATIAFLGEHPYPSQDTLTRLAVSLVAIAITTVITFRDRSIKTTLSEQARVLELSHDTVIIRDPDDVILYWNDGAEQLYGWKREEAIGRNCDVLMRTILPSPATMAELEREGKWSGEIVRTRRDGTELVLASRWMLRRDPEGRPAGIIESSADLTDQRRVAAERRTSEDRFRTMFDMAGFAAWESDWSETMRVALDSAPDRASIESWLSSNPETAQRAASSAVVSNANQAAVDLFRAPSREFLIGANLMGRYTPESTRAFSEIVAALAEGARSAEKETHLRTLDGRIVDAVVRVTVLPEGAPWSHMLVMAFDVTERNEVRARLEQALDELAHAGRVSMLGQLAASIAHEVNQPLAAIVNYGKSGIRWLSRAEPESGEALACLEKIVSNSARASEVITRVRSLARKATPQRDEVGVHDLIDDAIMLIQREARAAEVAVRRDGDEAPLVLCDRVQVQQVLVNLLLNAIQAMKDIENRKRVLTVRVSAGPDEVGVAVEDCGTGLPEDGNARLFEPFFTTKKEGMGMGLSICRTIIEAQGGRIGARNNEGKPGATVSFTLPVAREEAPATAQLIS